MQERDQDKMWVDPRFVELDLMEGLEEMGLVWEVDLAWEDLEEEGRASEAHLEEEDLVWEAHLEEVGQAWEADLEEVGQAWESHLEEEDPTWVGKLE